MDTEGDIMTDIARDMLILYGVFVAGFVIGAVIAGIIFHKLDEEAEK